MFSLPFDSIQSIRFSSNKKTADVPLIRKGVFTLQETGDTYLDMSSWARAAYG